MINIERKNESLTSSLSSSSSLSSTTTLSLRDRLLNIFDSVWNCISINPFIINIELRRNVMNNFYKYLIYKGNYFYFLLIFYILYY